MTRRGRLGIAAAAVLAAGVTGMAVSPDVTPAVLAVFAALAAWYVRPHPEQLALIAGSAGAVSLTATAIIRSSGRHLAPGSSASSWQFVEIAALLLL